MTKDIPNARVRVPRPLPAALYFAFVVGLGLFAYFASVIDNFPGEINTSVWIQSHRSPALDAVMNAVSQTSRQLMPLPVLAGIVAAIFLKRWRFDSIMLVGASITGYIVMTLLKEVIARPRPSPEVVQLLGSAEGYAFPSAHVMLYSVILGTLAFIVVSRMGPGALRTLVLGASGLFLLATGYSRIYLGVHWLSDVIGGYAFGLAVVIAFIWLWRRWLVR